MVRIKPLLLLFMFLVGVEGLGNPYHVLGISNSASLQEIRKAYKQLAKEWHPDKNKDPAAENKFVEINQAYEPNMNLHHLRHETKQGILGDQLLGPLVLPVQLTGSSYLRFLQSSLPELLVDVPLQIHQRMWFMHDGAPPHITKLL